MDTVIQHAPQLRKPQLSFSRPVDNSDRPWYLALSHKYNAQVPLGHTYQEAGEGESSSSAMYVSPFIRVALHDKRLRSTNHPYRYEITHLKYPSRMFGSSTPIQPPPLEETAATWVSDETQFEAMLENLRSAHEIAVDLEHHSYRSYAGFLCLMQISDREQDWVIDLLALRDNVEALNEIFTNPAIVKVLLHQAGPGTN